MIGLEFHQLQWIIHFFKVIQIYSIGSFLKDVQKQVEWYSVFGTKHELEDLWGHWQTVPKVKAVNSLTRVDNRHVRVRSALVHFTRNTSVRAAGLT